MINAQRLYRVTLDLWSLASEKLSSRILPIRPSKEPEQPVLEKLTAPVRSDDRLAAESLRIRRWL